MTETDKILAYLVKSGIKFNAGVANTSDMKQVVCINVELPMYGPVAAALSKQFTQFKLGILVKQKEDQWQNNSKQPY